jgi:phospholipase C
VNYSIRHVLISTFDIPVKTERVENKKKMVFSSKGNFPPIRYPGTLKIVATGSYHISQRVEDQSETGHHGSRTETQTVPFNGSVKIYSPDGLEFTAGQITIDDLNHFRDLLGVSQGIWRYTVHGDSGPIDASEPPPAGSGESESTVTPGSVQLFIAIDETIPSQSAGPLVDGQVGTGVYSFDLYRVGQLQAKVRSKNPLRPWKGSLRLKDPNGTVVASSATSLLQFPVTLRSLDQSRDASGNIRKWSLEVRTTEAGVLDSTVRATVISTVRIPVSLINDRIKELIGEKGNKISIYGENKDNHALLRLMIRDKYTAETLEINDWLDTLLKKVKQDSGYEGPIKTDFAYNIINKVQDFPYGLSFYVGSFKVKELEITFGGSKHIKPVVPALTVSLSHEGRIVLDAEAIDLGSITLKGNSISLETGLMLNNSGDIETVSWIGNDALPSTGTVTLTGRFGTVTVPTSDQNLIDIDVTPEAYAAAAAATAAIGLPGLGALGLLGFKEWLNGWADEKIRNTFRSTIEDAIFQVKHVLWVLLGGNFSLTSLRMEGEEIVIDYVSPVEPEPKPNKWYKGIIGRTVSQEASGAWIFHPRSLGDTWAADNLKNKIKHIVVVMMENRSFDHVLGYRALLPGAENENGLTLDLIGFLGGKGFTVRALNASRIEPNGLNMKTKFPAHVGHHFTDVAEQLKYRLQYLDSSTINSPQGFVENFEDRVVDGLDKDDVLGYYTGDDLHMHRFLAENYAYCQRFFCSHPGPTLPNRFIWLTGHLQYDYTGEVILENSNPNFQLSRDLNIFDILSRKGISWRVYESFPSVAALRLYARYATDNTNIVPITDPQTRVKRLEADIAAGNLSDVTFIEPQMHAGPEDDDHPPADMQFGQIFIKRVYDALRSNEAIWKNTLLIITYDEHGGFYDHVIPPLADGLSPERYGTEGATTEGFGGVGAGGAAPGGTSVSRGSTRAARVRPWLTGDTSVSRGSTGITGVDGVTIADTLDPNKSFKKDMTIPYGLRVPTFVVSPWVPQGKGPDLVLDHCSIIKTILARFCGDDKPFLSDRVNASRSFESYLTLSEPRLTDVPSSPSLGNPESPLRGRGERRRSSNTAITTKPVIKKAMDEGEADYHDITGMLARMLGR